ncbi:MAG: Rpn family recombination-promoting nuclease/putative transposase, partial [Tannerella sp.]|nr:Rpn family recombination-promoting nuclease/putative transposase [Tannerella sp.]
FRRLFRIAEIACFTPEEALDYEESLKHYRDLINVIDTAVEEAREEAHEKGREEGREEGEAIGLAKGEQERLKLQQEIDDLKRLLEKK